MNKFVLDAYAWIEYLNGSERGNAIVSIVDNKNNEIFTSAATLSEVLSKFLRTGKSEFIAINSIHSLSSVVPVSSDIAVGTARIHHDQKKKNKNFGMLDSFVVATAQNVDAKIITGDDDFKGLKNVIFI
ncbi:PIN domain-containing protein [Candidatus Woesearchaeota archaeon]|nr:PIN domain-containing protein [Candidatus Woesearchaeota archaeon]